MAPDAHNTPAFKVAAIVALALAATIAASRAHAADLPTIGRPTCETVAPTMTGSAALAPLTACSWPNPSASHPAAAEPVRLYGSTPTNGHTVVRSSDGRFIATTTTARTSHDESTTVSLRHAKDGSPYFTMTTTTRRR